MRDDRALETLLGQTVTAVAFGLDRVEVTFGDGLLLTGYTTPFGIMGCQGVGPRSIRILLGRRVDHVEVVAGRHVAIDAGEHRLAFPIDPQSRADVRNAVDLVQAESPESGPARHWSW